MASRQSEVTIHFYSKVYATTLSILALMAIASPALADPPYQIEVRSRVLVGREPPALIVRATATIRGLEVRLRSEGLRPSSHRVASLLAGASREFPIPAPVGVSSWIAEVRHAGAKESSILTFEVVVARPIEIRMAQGDVDLANGEVSFTATEAVTRVRIEVFSEDGSRLRTIEEAVSAPPGQRVRVRFDRPPGSVGRLVVTVFDTYDFYNGVEVTPIFIEIPHEQVHFDFDSAVIQPAEEPKLARTLMEVRAAIARLSSAFSPRLYIAGYTDTVGGSDYNRDLSRRRAEAIARWFRAHGLSIGVCWQGFGEDALAIPTPDDTPEPRNRRTLHVLADQPPPVSNTFPASAWKCLP